MQIDSVNERYSAGYPVRNQILLRIPPNEFQALQPHLEFRILGLADQLQEPNASIDAAYFLNTGLISMLVYSRNGRAVEVGAFGREDVAGLSLVAGLSTSNCAHIVQVPGEGFRILAAPFLRLLPKLPGLSCQLQRLLAVRFSLLAQNAACNRLHSAPQRLARWLLITRDRVGLDEFAFTHDFLSMLVGTDRPTVSNALAALENTSIVKKARASITIVDRLRLEQKACECYGIYKQFNPELGLGERS